MELFKRRPRLFMKIDEQQDIIPGAAKNKYPKFDADFLLLEKELLPSFRELEKNALKNQNAYRWMYVILLIGGALATILGIIRLAFDVELIGLTGAIVAALLGCISLALRSLPYHRRYLNARLAAEQLRGEFFLFLGRIGPYADEQKRVSHLKQRVVDIKHEGERDESA